MNNVDKIIKILNKKNIDNIEYAIVVGSGLIESVPDLQNVVSISYTSLKMPASKVKGHLGAFRFGELYGKKVMLVSRMHFYESGDINLVRLPFEIMKKLGVKKVVLLTSCGGVNISFKVGDIMLIKDQINLTGTNPLIGIDPMEFTSMTNAYDYDTLQYIRDIAKNKKIDLKEGVHIQLSGPSYETPAEVKFIRGIGADSVSMSTAMDTIICNYLQMKVCGFSVVVNVFTDTKEELTHEEVLQNAKLACKNIKTILTEFIKNNN